MKTIIFWVWTLLNKGSEVSRTSSSSCKLALELSCSESTKMDKTSLREIPNGLSDGNFVHCKFQVEVHQGTSETCRMNRLCTMTLSCSISKILTETWPSKLWPLCTGPWTHSTLLTSSKWTMTFFLMSGTYWNFWRIKWTKVVIFYWETAKAIRR